MKKAGYAKWVYPAFQYLYIINSFLTFQFPFCVFAKVIFTLQS